MPSFGADYGAVAGATASSATSWAMLQNIIASKAAQRKQGTAAFKTERANIRSEAIGQMSEAINGAIEGGMLGSSAAGQAQIGVLADRRQQIEAARTELKAANLQGKVEVQQQVMDYTITQEQIALQAKAAQDAAALQAQAIAAAQANTAALLAGLPGGGGGSKGTPIMVGGQAYTPTKVGPGRFEVAGQIFDEGTPVSTIINSIRRKRGETRALAFSGTLSAPSPFQRGQR
jgi:hypothetical protein